MLLNILSSPLFIIFLVITSGYLMGKIKAFNISLGLCAILIIGVSAGYLVNLFTPFSHQQLSELQRYTSVASSLGSALFVSVIGITAGYSFNIKKSSHIKAMLIGAGMVGSAFLVMQLIFCLNGEISHSKLLGAFCGALTTTPGLSAVCELVNVNAAEATVSYGMTYIFGVLLTVIFVQFCLQFSDNKCVAHLNHEASDFQSVKFECILQIGSAVLLGIVLGSIKISGFSVGISGGILCAGLIIGAVIMRISPQKCDATPAFDLLKKLGLSLFLAGNGISAGMQLNFKGEIEMMFYGILMTFTPLATGYVLCKLLFINDKKTLPIILAGGMTSTPAIAMLSEKRKDISLDDYSMAYVSALLSMIFFIRCAPFGAFLPDKL